MQVMEPEDGFCSSVLAMGDIVRLHRADVAAYGGMFAAAGPRIGSGRAFVGDGSAMAMWNPRDESCAYNTIIAFEQSPDPDATWVEGRAAAVAGGARVFGVGLVEERYAWGSPARLAALELELEYEELVWARRLDDGGPLPSLQSTGLPGGVELVTDGLDRDVFGQVLNQGWEVPENHGRGPLYAATIGLPGWTHYLALIDDQAAGASALYCGGGVALFMVAATAPAFRGRGLQGAFIARRFDDALAAGCTLGAAETVDDNASPRNFQRAGFQQVARRLMYRTESLA